MYVVSSKSPSPKRFSCGNSDLRDVKVKLLVTTSNMNDCWAIFLIPVHSNLVSP